MRNHNSLAQIDPRNAQHVNAMHTMPTSNNKLMYRKRQKSLGIYEIHDRHQRATRGARIVDVRIVPHLRRGPNKYVFYGNPRINIQWARARAANGGQARTRNRTKRRASRRHDAHFFPPHINITYHSRLISRVLTTRHQKNRFGSDKWRYALMITIE